MLFAPASTEIKPDLWQSSAGGRFICTGIPSAPWPATDIKYPGTRLGIIPVKIYCSTETLMTCRLAIRINFRLVQLKKTPKDHLFLSLSVSLSLSLSLFFDHEPYSFVLVSQSPFSTMNVLNFSI